MNNYSCMTMRNNCNYCWNCMSMSYWSRNRSKNLKMNSYYYKNSSTKNNCKMKNYCYLMSMNRNNC